MVIPTTQNVRRPVASGYGALLTYGDDDGDDVYVQLAPSGREPIRRATAPTGQQGPNLAVNPEDFRPESGRIFSRNAFSGGEGLARGHRADGTPLDGTRFWDANGIRLKVPRPGDPEEIILGWDTENVPNADAAVSPYVCKVADGTTVFWADGWEVAYSSNLTAASPTITKQDPGTLSGDGQAAIVGMGLDGKTLYAALNGGKLHRRTWAGTWSAWSDLVAKKVWVAKGRVLAAIDNVLYEAAAGAGSTALKTIAADDDWEDIIDAGHLILAAASDGKIYAFSDEAGTLILRGETPMRPGEVPVALAFADGLVFIGVADDTVAGGKLGRLYVAQLSGVRLRGARLIREWGVPSTTSDHSPYRLRATRDEVLCSVLDDDEQLAVFSYLLATAGTYRRYDSTVVVRCDLEIVDESLIVWPLADIPIREEDDTYKASGWLMTPYADWYSAALKGIVGLRIENPDIAAAGAQIDLYYTTDPDDLDDPDSSGWILAKTLDTETPSVTDEVPLLEVTGRGVALMVKLTRSTAGTTTPRVRSLSVRSFEDHEDVVWTLPVNVSDVIERPGKMPIRVPGRGQELYDLLASYEGRPMKAELLRGGEKISGRVESLDRAIPALTPRGASMLVANLTIRGVSV
jgi:hypothetical protein